MIYPLKGKRVWVAGHNGLVGSAIIRRLQSEPCDIITADRKDLDLTRQTDVETWMHDNKPDTVFLAAARVGGIKANSDYPAEFMHQNLMIQSNVIHASYVHKVQKLLFLGSSCIYPKNCNQPMCEDALMSGSLEPSNEPYAIAKIAGIEMCKSYRKQYGCNFIAAMPTNLYGLNDNFDLETAHAPAAFIRRFMEAKKNGDDEVIIWGSGKPLREFMSSDDLADACVFLMQNYSDEGHINIGTGHEISIIDLAKMIAEIVGYKGKIKTNPSKPDGPMQKRLDSSKIKALGWEANIDLKIGLHRAYTAYEDNLRITS